MNRTRRNVLKHGAAIATAGALAGCTSGGNADGGATDGSNPSGDSDADTPAETASGAGSDGASSASAGESDTPNGDYARWLPAPDAIGEDAYAFQSVAPAELEARGAGLGEDALAIYVSDVDFPGVDSLTDATAVHQFAGTTMVVEGGVNADAAESGLRDADFSEVETRHGFTVFDAGGTAACAVGEDSLVAASDFRGGDAGDKRPLVDAALDAYHGEADRYAEVNADCRELLDTLGSGHVLLGQSYEAGTTFENAVAEGMTATVGEEATSLDAAVVFTDGDAHEDAVAEWAEQSDGFHGQSPTTVTDGRVVTASASVATADLEAIQITPPRTNVLGGGDERQRAPRATFRFEYEGERDGVGTLTITHDSGDAIPVAELQLRGSGFADVDGVDQTEAGEWQGTATGDDDPAVAAGDRVTVGVASDYEIDVVWRASDGDASATLATVQGPDA